MFWLQIILAFFAGIVFSMFMSTFMTLGYSVIIFKVAHLECLAMLKSTADSIGRFVRYKSTAAKISGRSEEFVENEKEMFIQNYDIMRDSAILKLKNSIPNKFKTFAVYNNWDEAMEFLQQGGGDDRKQ